MWCCRPHYAAVLLQTVAGTAGTGRAFPLGGREGGREELCSVTVTQGIETNKLKGSQQNKNKSQTDRNSKSLGAGGPPKYLIFEPWPIQGIRLHGRTQKTSSKQMPMLITFFLNTDRPPKARWRNVILCCLWIPNSVSELSSSWWAARIVRLWGLTPAGTKGCTNAQCNICSAKHHFERDAEESCFLLLH